jgi:hypothetical protein
MDISRGCIGELDVFENVEHWLTRIWQTLDYFRAGRIGTSGSFAFASASRAGSTIWMILNYWSKESSGMQS